MRETVIEGPRGSGHTIRSLILFCILLGAPAGALAQPTSGSIRGTVTDAVTSEPLEGVNLVLLDSSELPTGLGAATSAQGTYVILDVPPGRWHLRATHIGHLQVEVRDLAVGAGRSVTQDFRLQPTLLDLGIVATVSSMADPLARDVPSTFTTFEGEVLRRMPSDDALDALAVQNAFYEMQGYNNMIPGYRERGQRQTHMRGGRNAEVAFLIDGMQVTNLVFGGPGAPMNVVGVNEMVTLVGGMSAEYGNAISGVVNMVTADGGGSYGGELEVFSSELSGVPQDDVRDRTQVQTYLGGPAPRVPGFTFFVSGSARTQRDYLTHRDGIVFDSTPSSPEPGIVYSKTDPYTQYGPDGRRIWRSDVYSGWLGCGIDSRWDAMLNVSGRIGRAARLKISTSVNGRDGIPWTFDWRNSMTWGMPKSFQDALMSGIPREPRETPLPDPIIPGTGALSGENEKNRLTEQNGRLAAAWSHQVSPATYYTLRASWYGYRRRMRVNRWVNDDGYYGDRSLFTERTKEGYSEPPAGKWVPGDPMHEVTLLPIPYNINDPTGRAYGYTAIRGMGAGNQNSDRYYSDQLDGTRSLRADVTSQVTFHHQMKAGLQYNALSLDELDVQLLYLDPPYYTDYRRTPWELGLYLQDRIEADEMVLLVGVRYDTGVTPDGDPLVPILLGEQPRDPFTGDPYDLLYERSQPYRFDKVRSALQPRLGVSHAIDERGVVYFNVGWYAQRPVYRNVYLQGTLFDSIPLLGNPDLENERSVQAEMGWRHQMSERVSASVTLWTKDYSGLVASRRFPAFYGGWRIPYTFTTFGNFDYETARGIDLEVRKAFADRWMGRLSYAWSATSATADDPWSGYRDGDALEAHPRRPHPAGWDQPHRFSALLDVILPDGDDPVLWGLHPLARTSFSIVYRGAAGRPYTPTTKERALDPDSGRRPWTHQVDLRSYRDVTLLGMDMGITVDVRNLFGRRNVYSVFSRTGSAGDPGPEATSISDNYDRSFYYGTPRTIDVGLRIRF